MPKPTQAEADLALHAYGQRMRAIWDQRQVEFERNFAAFKDAAREDLAQVQEPKIEAPEIGPKQSPDLEALMKERTKGIEAPEIGPPKDRDREGPDMDR